MLDRNNSRISETLCFRDASFNGAKNKSISNTTIQTHLILRNLMSFQPMSFISPLNLGDLILVRLLDSLTLYWFLFYEILVLYNILFLK